MGNLCSKRPSQADNDPFAQPGRILGNTPAKPSEPRAQIPKTTSGGQRLGTNAPANQATSSSFSSPQNQDSLTSSSSAAAQQQPDPRREAAAKAAEERYAKGKERVGTGKLARELEKQRGMTRNDTLKSMSEQERRAREVDEGNKIKSYD